ncbi:hypothetical protein ONZ45_g10480 [Pleurotus djamor]|nr:hypothetical protein ONZ45_g10480 [Pleurotus djamor]
MTIISAGKNLRYPIHTGINRTTLARFPLANQISHAHISSSSVSLPGKNSLGARNVQVTDIDRGFLDVLHTIATIGSDTYATVKDPLLGAIGPFISPVTGCILAAISTPTITTNPYCIPPPGIAERAVLSEASLEALLVLYQDNPNDPVIKMALSDMSQAYMDYAPQVGDIATAFAPWTVDFAIDATQSISLGLPLPRGLFKKSKHSNGMAEYQKNTSGRGRGPEGAFVEGLIGGTVSAPRTKPPRFVKKLISRAVVVKEPLVSKVSKEALATIRPYLLTYPTHTNCSVSPAAQFASGLLFQRALVADTALSAMRKLSRSQLDRLKLNCAGRLTGLQEGSIFDFIRSTIERIAPCSLRVAYRPLQHVEASLSFAGAEKRRLELGGIAHSTSPNHGQPRVTYIMELDDPAPDFYRIADGLLNRE